jgi:hypothetical protein
LQTGKRTRNFLCIAAAGYFIFSIAAFATALKKFFHAPELHLNMPGFAGSFLPINRQVSGIHTSSPYF